MKGLFQPHSLWYKCCKLGNIDCVFDKTGVSVKNKGRTWFADKDAPCYPENLRCVPEPPALYVRGNVMPQDRVCVAIVGARRATSLGKSLCYELSKTLARAGVTVACGLTGDIATKARQGVSDGNGRALVCLPRGLSSKHEDISVPGAFLSEYRDETPPAPWRHVAKHRIIPGLALGLVVVEARNDSRSLLAVDWAIRFGRPVMAFPGSPRSSAFSGTNRLIQEGAFLVTGAQDVLSFLSREDEYVPNLSERIAPFPDGAEQTVIMQGIKEGALTAQQLAESMPRIPPAKIMAALGVLEVKGLVVRESDGRYAPARLLEGL